MLYFSAPVNQPITRRFGKFLGKPKLTELGMSYSYSHRVSDLLSTTLFPRVADA